MQALKSVWMDYSKQDMSTKLDTKKLEDLFAQAEKGEGRSHALTQGVDQAFSISLVYSSPTHS